MLGQIVIYKLDKSDKDEIAKSGWSFNVTDELPAIIVQYWGGGCANIKVITDGNGPDLWVTSVIEGTEERTWRHKA